MKEINFVSNREDFGMPISRIQLIVANTPWDVLAVLSDVIQNNAIYPIQYLPGFLRSTTI